MMKIMGVHFQDTGDNRVAYAFAFIGSFWQTLMNIDLPTDWLSKLVEAGITAAVCGVIGVAAKDLYKLAKTSFIAYFKNRKKSKNDVGQNQ